MIPPPTIKLFEVLLGCALTLAQCDEEEGPQHHDRDIEVDYRGDQGACVPLRRLLAIRIDADNLRYGTVEYSEGGPRCRKESGAR